MDKLEIYIQPYVYTELNKKMCMKMDLLNKITNRDLSKRLDEKYVYSIFQKKTNRIICRTKR